MEKIEARMRTLEVKVEAQALALGALLSLQSEDMQIAFVKRFRDRVDREVLDFADGGLERTLADELETQAARITSGLAGRLGGPSRP